MLIQLLIWTVFGLIVGGIVRLLFPGPDPLGWIGTILLGVGGAWLGGFLAYLVWGTDDGGIHPSGFIGALIGGALLLLLLRSMRRRSV